MPCCTWRDRKEEMHIFCCATAENFICGFMLFCQKKKIYNWGHFGDLKNIFHWYECWPCSFFHRRSNDNYFCAYLHILQSEQTTRHHVETSQFSPSVNTFLTGTSALPYPLSQWSILPLWVTEKKVRCLWMFKNPYFILNYSLVSFLHSHNTVYMLTESRYVFFDIAQSSLRFSGQILNPVYSQRCIPLSLFDIWSKWIGWSYF